METRKEKTNSAKRIAITQIVLLVVGLFAVSWMIGEVSAVDEEAPAAQSGNQGTEREELGSIKKLAPIGIGALLNKEKEKIMSTLKTPFKPGTEKGVEEAVKESVSKQIADPGVKIVRESFGFKEFVFGTENAEGTWAGVGGGYETIGVGAEIGAIAVIAAWSSVSFLLGRYFIGPALGLNVQQAQGLGYSLALGTATTLTLTSQTLLGGATLGVGLSLGIGVGVAFIVSLFTIKNASADIIKYSCYNWDAETGGKNCELCNKQDIECTEYQCHSLGQGCEFSVDEISGQALCVWENSKDIKAPVIKPRDESLLDKKDYRYTPDNSLSPPDTGVKVQYTGSQDGCAPAWSQVSFGVKLDERARCKISPGIIYDSYDEMPDLFMSGGIRTYNHTFRLSLPSTKALEAENITVENGGIYDFYVRCIDSNGNSNSGNFAFKFCIQEGPDTTPPVIDHTSPISETPFASGQTEFDINIYVNEPSECKWSTQDKNYDSMENEFSCSTSVLEMNAQNLFGCSATLDGLKDNQKNNFYFRCKDQPGANESMRNVNEQSYKYVLIGTQELAIDYAKPNNEAIRDSTSRIPVEIEVQTSLGYDDGKAVCSFSETGEEGSYISFFYGQGVELYSQYKHTQLLNLEKGDYKYYIRCYDLGGNTDETTISFSVETDLEPPEVVRAFRDSGNLKIITSEEGRCVYSDFGCTYDFDQDGTYMSSVSGGDDTEHYASWPEDAKTTYYIKCQDAFGNRPLSSQCSLIVRPFDIPDIR